MSIIEFCIIFLSIYFVSILLHEVGHVIAYRAHGKKVEFCIVGTSKEFRLSFLNPEYSFKFAGTTFILTPWLFSGVTLSSDFTGLDKKELFKIAASGPVVNIFLFLSSASVLIYGYTYLIFHESIFIILISVAALNFSLSVVNLYPIVKDNFYNDGAIIKAGKFPYDTEQLQELVLQCAARVNNEKHKNDISSLYK